MGDSETETSCSHCLEWTLRSLSNQKEGLRGTYEDLRLEVNFLKMFIWWAEKDESLKDNVKSIEDATVKIYRETMISFYQTPSLINQKQCSTLVDKFRKSVMPAVREVYGIDDDGSLLPTRSSSNPLRAIDAITFLKDVLDILKNLLNLDYIESLLGTWKVEELYLTFSIGLKYFLVKESTKTEELDGLWISFQTLAIGATHLLYRSLEKMNNMNIRSNLKLLDLLREVKSFKLPRAIYGRIIIASCSEDSSMTEELAMKSLSAFQQDLMELLNLQPSFMVPVKHQVEKLHEELKFLSFLLLKPPKQYKHEKLDFPLKKIGDVISEGVAYIYFPFCGDMDEGMAKSVNYGLLDLLERMKHILAPIEKIVCNFPSFPELSFIDFFLGNLEELLTHRVDSVADMKHHIETVHMELVFLRSFLYKTQNRGDEDDELKALRKRITQVAYRADFIIDSFVARVDHVLQLSDVTEEIDLIKEEVNKTYAMEADDTRAFSLSRASSHVSSVATTPNIDEVVVGFEDEAEAIRKRLVGEPDRLDVVSIVGMPGLGKTTLTKKVYNDPFVAHHFHVRAWCCISQTYQKRELLLDILGDFVELTNAINKKSDEELAALLYRTLKKQRYLIVLDDMWESQAWTDLKRSFPDDNNQSRIMITSRSRNVALQVTPDSEPHSLRLFSDGESWKLLEEKIFHIQKCPQELSEVGNQIARNCRGLPLAVVLAAGLLARMDRKESQWKKFAETLNSRIVSAPDNQCIAIMELSYKHLPDHLKPCYLYFGAFPEDQDIPVWKLTWLWIAEGFVQTMEPKRLEDVAKDYLMDLIGRSLVIYSRISSSGGVKACRVHDLLRDFCLAKAEEENFLQSIRGYDKLLPPSVEVLDYGDGSDQFYALYPPIYKHYRLSIYSKRKHFVMARPSGQRVRSLLLVAAGDMYPHYPYDVSFIYCSFKLLRVLDLGCINIGNFIEGVEFLVYLRYLAVRMNIEFIPASIAKLWRLETLLLKGLRVQVVHVPDFIWNMENLRHLHIDDHASFSFSNCGLEKSYILDNLETFSTPSLTYGDDMEQQLRSVPNLRKLRCIFVDSWDPFKQLNRFPVLDFLNELVSLKVSCNYKFSGNRYPCEFHLPSSLKKLTLSNFGLPWSEISSIGRQLPNLEVLKLLHAAFEGKTWDMKDGEFPKLKFLKLDTLNIIEWNASDDHFPCLERLVLLKCKKLQEIPLCFGGSSTLQMIEVLWCSRSAADSARSILDEQKDYGNESFKIHIYPKEQDPGVPSKD